MLMTDRVAIQTPTAPAAVGPYSQGIKAGNFIFCSGQLPIDPATGQLVEADITAQTHMVLKNLENVLLATGSGLHQVVKATVFLSDMANFDAMNKVYATYFAIVPPARSTFQVARLPKDALVEIEAIAVMSAPPENPQNKPF